jgi:ABC-2 type transport system permease protein
MSLNPRIVSMKRLFRMEWLKTAALLNIVFSSVVFLLVLMQVAFVVRLDLGDAAGNYSATTIYYYAFRYINNIAFTFIPILFLVNIGCEFDYAVVQRSLVSGISRDGYFMGKIIQLVLFSLFAFLLAIIFTLLIAAIYQVSIEWNFARLAMYFIVSFCLGSFSMMIVFLLKKRFYALAVFIVYVLLENTLTAVIPAQAVLFPLNTCIRLLRQGIYGADELMMVTAYTLFCLGTGYQAFKRSDLR